MSEHGAHCSVRNTWLQARASMTARRLLDHLKFLEMESAGFQRDGTHVSLRATPLHFSV